MAVVAPLKGIEAARGAVEQSLLRWKRCFGLLILEGEDLGIQSRILFDKIFLPNPRAAKETLAPILKIS